MSVINPSKGLKGLLTANETLVMPDAYDAISARIIEQAGFKAVQCSGYSSSVGACKKQEIDIGSEENVAVSATIKALLESTDALKSGVFTSLVAKGCLCSPRDIGRLIGA